LDLRPCGIYHAGSRLHARNTHAERLADLHNVVAEGFEIACAYPADLTGMNMRNPADLSIRKPFYLRGFCDSAADIAKLLARWLYAN
jgi:hypothetical protein